MLQVVVGRIRAAWPAAEVNVVTADPDNLEKFLPGTHPVPFMASRQLLSEGCLFGRLGVRSPQPEAFIRSRIPNLALHLTGSMMRLRKIHTSEYDDFAGHLTRADLVLASGGGYVNDVFPLGSIYTLRLLEFASSLGKPTAMLGQGLGPSISSEVRAACTATFPRLNLLTLREGLKSPALSRELGAREDRTYVTGDDAIELTRDFPSNPTATGIGIGIRSSQYAQLPADLVEVLRSSLHRKATAYQAPLIGVPISSFEQELDHKMVERITDGSDYADPTGAPHSPQDCIQQVLRCRLVVTGAYHAAVFALSCGVPVIGYASSDYYRLKFAGLAHQFRTGCTVLDTADSDFPRQLDRTIDTYWGSRDSLISPLREAALTQADASRSAFNKLLASI